MGDGEVETRQTRRTIDGKVIESTKRRQHTAWPPTNPFQEHPPHVASALRVISRDYPDDRQLAPHLVEVNVPRSSHASHASHTMLMCSPPSTSPRSSRGRGDALAIMFSCARTQCR
jgi:hypothetical protein